MKHTVFLSLILALPAVSYADVGELLRFGDSSQTSFSLAVAPATKNSVVFETPLSAPTAESYDTLILHGMLPDGKLRLQAYSEAAGKWQDMTVKRFDDGRFWARCRFASAGKYPLKVRAVDAGISSGNTIDIYEIETFLSTSKGLESDTPLAAVNAPSAPGNAAVTAQSADDGAKALPYVKPETPFYPRSAWNAKPPTEAYTPQTSLYRLTVHHTEGRQVMTVQDALKEMSFMQDYHQNGRGWIDIGYHFVIDGLGNVYEGRPYNVYGAHVESNNTGNVGISVMGNYHPPKSNQPTAETLATLERLVREFVARYGIPASNLYAHRELNATACPGDILYAVYGDIRKRIQADAAPKNSVDAAAQVQAQTAASQDFVQKLPGRVSHIISGW